MRNFQIYLPQSRHFDNELILFPLPVPKVFAPWLYVCVCLCVDLFNLTRVY